ncbi:hypothetical protein CR513_09374, partial [Mucuna pruriens]
MWFRCLGWCNFHNAAIIQWIKMACGYQFILPYSYTIFANKSITCVGMAFLELFFNFNAHSSSTTLAYLYKHLDDASMHHPTNNKRLFKTSLYTQATLDVAHFCLCIYSRGCYNNLDIYNAYLTVIRGGLTTKNHILDDAIKGLQIVDSTQCIDDYLH